MTPPKMEEIQRTGPSHLPLDKIQKYIHTSVCQRGPLFRSLGVLVAHQVRSHPVL